MVIKKQVEGEPKARDLWSETAPSITMRQFTKDTAETEKILWLGESNSGKTKGYLDILGYYSALKIPKENVMMCIVFPDRATGLTKLYNVIPKEYVDRVFPYTVNCYEDLVVATSTAEKKLLEHYKQTGQYGWLIIELMEEAWRMAQDYYSRQAYGETLADFLALQRESVKEAMKKVGKEGKDTAYMGLEGFKDWTIIKFFHNFNWIDRIKKMPFNVGATTEIKKETNKDSVFFTIGVAPAGEKDNVHRFDTIIYKSHKGDKFYMQCFKWTGMTRLYSETDITDKNSWSMHKKIQKQWEVKGYRSSAIEELEEEVGIKLPKIESTPVVVSNQVKVEPIKQVSKEFKVEPLKEKVELKPAATITQVSGTPKGETETKISKEELIQPVKKEEKKSQDDFDWSV